MDSGFSQLLPTVLGNGAKADVGFANLARHFQLSNTMNRVMSGILTGQAQLQTTSASTSTTQHMVKVANLWHGSAAQGDVPDPNPAADEPDSGAARPKIELPPSSSALPSLRGMSHVLGMSHVYRIV